MLEDHIQVTVVVDLELPSVFIVELMGDSKFGIKMAILPVKNELGSNCLSVINNLIENEEDLSELQELLAGRLVSQTNVNVATSIGQTEIVLL